MTKYIKLFEAWQWLNREEESDEGEREYSTTVDEFLTWLVGPDWAEDWEWLPEVLLVEWEELEEEEAIGYHEKLKRAADQQIEIYAQEEDGQIDVNWQLDGVNYSTMVWEWPFSEDEDLTEEEKSAVLKIVAEVKPESIGATTPDVIDWVLHQVRKLGQRPEQLNSAGFRNWFELGRAGLN